MHGISQNDILKKKRIDMKQISYSLNRRKNRILKKLVYLMRNDLIFYLSSYLTERNRRCSRRNIFEIERFLNINGQILKFQKFNKIYKQSHLFSTKNKESDEKITAKYFILLQFQIYQSIQRLCTQSNYDNNDYEKRSEELKFRRLIKQNFLDQLNPSLKCQDYLAKFNNIRLKIKKQRCVGATMIRKCSASKIQISEKLKKQILETINTSKGEISQLQMNKQIKLYVKSNLIYNKDQLLGGGGCCSKSEINESNLNTIKIIDENFNNNQNNEFVNEYKKWTHSEIIRSKIQQDNQLKIQKNLLKSCIVDRILQSGDQINNYSSEIQEIFEAFLMIEVTRVSKKSEVKQLEFERILQEVNTIESYEQDFPMMELRFYNEILINLNKLNHEFDESEQKVIMQIKEFINYVLNFNKNEQFSAMISSANKIKSEIHIFDKIKELFPLKYQVEILLRKIEQFGDKFVMISQEAEILFYVKFFFEIYKKQDQQDYSILTLIRINFILEKFLKENSQVNNKAQICQQFSNVLIQASIDEFLNELMQNPDIFMNQLFLIFSVENQNYRYISLSILLSIYSIFAMTLQNNETYEYLLEFLCNKYLTEKELAIRVIFEKSHEFVKYFNQNIKIESFKKKMIAFDQQRKQKLQPHVKSLKSHERSISSFDDIIKLISDNAIQKWERDIKKRQRSNIAQKDDVLLEVRDLYINQMITYLKGNPIFQKSKQNNDTEKESLINQQNALSDILKLFLNPDYSKRQNLIYDKSGKNDHDDHESNQNQFKDQSDQCQILGILAEGGTGKSMLMKKIEILLIEKLANLNVQTETGNFLPILVKCNSLDPKNPSLDEYLIQQGINEDMIQSLKQNNRNKLILLDGYDEYTGDYFTIYSTLRIKEWKNTKIIVATRKEKLSQQDACFFFSKQNDIGQIDEMSYTLVRLEEFTSKDIDEYAGRYFKQERGDNMSLIEKDLKNMRSCLANIELQKLLKLPINLYLFTRMLVNLDDKEIQNLKSNMSDQIGIQEIFFSDQFEREAQSFIDAYILSIDLKRDKAFKASIKDCYFEYFQTIGMLMFKNRGVTQGNYLQVERKNINFHISQSVSQILQKSQVDFLLDKIKNYINSKIITRVKSEQEQKISHLDERSQQFIEFKHKSLYEYFVARAMKTDFDIHGENIYKLKMEELEQFKINQKCIMNIGQNQSEQQVLFKLYKLIKKQIESDDFYQNYYEDLIEKNNRFIQYLKRSQIQTNSDTSKIDTGASNLISTLFLSRFSFPKLNLSLCSFSKAYISILKSDEINFDRCNLQHAFLQNSKINFDSCNTQSASFNAFSKAFDTSNIYSFNKILWGKNGILYSLSESGFINAFQMTNSVLELFQSMQLSHSPLSHILFSNDNLILVSSKYTLFSINSNNFEIFQTHKFKYPISDITLIEEKILVTLENQTAFKGTFKDGLSLLNNIGSVRGSAFNRNNQILVTYQNESFSSWNIKKNFELIETIQGHTSNINSVTFSTDGMYLATSSVDNTCKIWNAEKNFELINTIQGHNSSVIFAAFSADGKYLATSSLDKTCNIWNADNGFQLINTIQSQTSYVKSVAFSEDGEYLATGSEDNTCEIWNIEKGFELINTIQSHNNDISSVAFSVDGKYLVTGSFDKTCKIWKAEKGFELIYIIQGHTSYVRSVAFSTNGKYLATGSFDKTCKIWNAENGFELINTIQGHGSYINSVAFSSDGKYLATGSEDNTCKIWNAERNFELINTIEGHTSCITSVTFSADVKYLATGSEDKTCKIWNAEKCFELINTIQDHDYWVKSIAFSSDGKYLATGSQDKTCKIWNVEQGFKLINIIQGNISLIYSVAFSADGKYLATGSSDNTCKIWNAEKGFELVNTIQGHIKTIFSVTFSADGKYLATGSQDKTFKIWNVEKGFELINKNQGHTSYICSVAFSADGKYLATSSFDNTFKIWNAENGFELINTIQGHTSYITSVAFSANGKYFATGSSDKTCKIWNAENGFEFTNIILGHTEFVQSIAFSSDGKYLATGSSDNTCKIWNAENDFELINTIQGHDSWVKSVAFSADGQYLSTGFEDSTCKIWNAEKGFELINTIEGHIKTIQSVAFSSDGKYLATSSSDNTCKIWNVEKDFELVNTIQFHNSYVKSVAFSADGQYLATGSDDNTCKIWNAENGFELVNIIQGHDSWVKAVAFSADGKYLVTGSLDNTCKIWNSKKGFELINEIQGHTGAIFSVAFSADRKYIYIQLNDKSYSIYDLQNFKKIENQKKLELLQRKDQLELIQNYSLDQMKLFENMFIL